VPRNIKETGCANLTEMDIKLTDDKSVFYRSYGMSFNEHEQVKDNVQELIAVVIVEPSESPFASPTLLVKNKTVDVRLCVDCRVLNRKIEKQHYPLPRIGDQLDDRLDGKRFYASLDVNSGYYQVPMLADAKTMVVGFIMKRFSFDGWYRLKFLIYYVKRRRRLDSTKGGIGDVPVVVDDNDIDQIEDRMMLSLEEGQWGNKVFGLIKQFVLWIVFKIGE
jgi:hypothetical protein